MVSPDFLSWQVGAKHSFCKLLAAMTICEDCGEYGPKVRAEAFMRAGCLLTNFHKVWESQGWSLPKGFTSYVKTEFETLDMLKVIMRFGSEVEFPLPAWMSVIDGIPAGPPTGMEGFENWFQWFGEQYDTYRNSGYIGWVS